MKIKIISIGNEVLNGFTINTNAAYIAQELIKHGYEIAAHCVLPDGTDVLPNKLLTAIDEYPINICTGGLGPTTDDNTTEVIAKIFNSKLITNELVERELCTRYGNTTPSINKQALVPDKAQVLINEVGTAPGLILTPTDNPSEKIVIFLPGVPQEMQHLLQHKVIPYLNRHFTFSAKKLRKIINFYQIKEVEIDDFLQQNFHQELQTINYGLYPNLGIVTLHLVQEAKTEASFLQAINPIITKLEQQFKYHIFYSNSIAEEVLKQMKERNFTLSLAESCSGGAIAASLTKISGSSKVFYGSAVVYDNSAKVNILNVKENTLKQHGAVSAETVAEMLDGTLNTFNTDFAISVSGIAGPNGGTPTKPVGTVFIGIGNKNNQATIKKFNFSGNRDMIITRTVHHALAELLTYLGTK